jgi:ubiquinone/menaquinone biosynthesis C-methylase UbiE
VDERAKRARSFDRVAEEYDLGRPGYPDDVLDLLAIADTAAVLDLAAGTGKLTRVLARRYRRVIAVEPLEAMRAIIGRGAPAAETLAGRAEAIPLRDAEVDAVFVAQAIHWFANDAAVAEIARVLRPGGVLAIVRNEVDDEAESPLPEAYRDRLRELFGDRTESPTDWRDAVARGPFGEISQGSVEHEQVSDREGVLAFALSLSLIAHRPEEARRQVMDELGWVLPEGEYRFRMRTEVSWTIRHSSAPVS